MPALVERDAVELAAQRQAAEIPGARRLSAAVEEERGRPAGRAPVEVVEPDAAEHGVLVPGADELRELEAGEAGGQPMVLALGFGVGDGKRSLGHGSSGWRARRSLLRLV